MQKRLISFLLTEKLPLFRGKAERDRPWVRVVMDRETNRLINDLSFDQLNTLVVSGEKWKDFGFGSYESKCYPDFDVTFDKPDRQYDLVIAEQVFEHLLRPYKAGTNIYDMLNEDGYFLITTPFLIRIHPNPDDCTRWTETGLKYFWLNAASIWSTFRRVHGAILNAL